MSQWKNIVQRKLAIRSTLIQPYLPCNSDHVADDDIILAIDDINTLTDLYRQGKLLARTVVECYVRRAAEAQIKTNCLTEVLFSKAIDRAIELDHYFQSRGELIGPLHGVPISLKDQFNIAGYDTSIGYVARAFRPMAQNAALVDILVGLGAVILAKTNLPQSIMWSETENPLWGLTTNPLNPALTPGGSSGGEGALLALRGSLVGFGTDLGGSIRVPGHINGLWGLKPSHARLPYAGAGNSMEGQNHSPSSIGPMGRSLASVTAVMRHVLDAKPWLADPAVVPIGWRQEQYEEVQSRKLTIGLILDDNVVRVHPPIRRVLESLVEKLEAAGHEVVPWDCSEHEACMQLMDALYTVDGGQDIRSAIEAGGEPAIPHVEAFVARGKPISVYEYWQLNKQKTALQQAYNKKWNDARSPVGDPVDLLLSPTMPHAAVPHRTCRWLGYTKVWNALDYSALSFPAGAVRKDLDSGIDQDYTPRNDQDAWNWGLFDVEKMDGHPIGLQIIGRRFEEERVLGAARVIARLLK